MSTFRLMIRSPSALVVDQDIFALCAEDLDGFFGLRPGRADVMAVLPAGLLVFRDQSGETFVALSGGLLYLREGVCRVAARDAVASRNLDEIASVLAMHLERRRKRKEMLRDVLADLATEAVRRLAGMT